MWETEKDFAVKLGGNLYVSCACLITYEEQPLFNIARRDSDHRLGIDFDVYGQDGTRIATVRRSNIVQGDRKRFDIHHGADVKTMTDKETGEVLVRIDKRPFRLSDFCANRKTPPLPPEAIENLKHAGIDPDEMMSQPPPMPPLPDIAVELDVSLRTYLPQAGFMLIADPDKTNVSGIVASGNVMVGCGVGIALGKSHLAMDGVMPPRTD